MSLISFLKKITLSLSVTTLLSVSVMAADHSASCQTSHFNLRYENQNMHLTINGHATGQSFSPAKRTVKGVDQELKEDFLAIVLTFRCDQKIKHKPTKNLMVDITKSDLEV